MTKRSIATPPKQVTVVIADGCSVYIDGALARAGDRVTVSAPDATALLEQRVVLAPSGRRPRGDGG